jgi:hypothetical protein
MAHGHTNTAIATHLYVSVARSRSTSTRSSTHEDAGYNCRVLTVLRYLDA